MSSMISLDEPSKRRRLEANCAECKRLKVKCDRKVPCGACARRGCPELCPGESLGVKELFAERAELREKVRALERIIRAAGLDGTSQVPGLQGAALELEGQAARNTGPERPMGLGTALSVFDSCVTGQPPRASSFVRLGGSSNGQSSTSSSSQPQIPPYKQQYQHPIANTGTLVVRSGGRSKFIGPSAMPLWLSQDDRNTLESRPSSPPPLHHSVPSPSLSSAGRQRTNPFPLSSTEQTLTWSDACSQLPSKDEAWSRAECNYRYLAWNSSAFSRQDFSRTFEAIYDQMNAESGSEKRQTNGSSYLEFQQLAWIYVVIALGTLFSLELRADDASGHVFFSMAQQCLVRGQFLTFSTVIGVHTTSLLARYCSYADMPAGLDLAYHYRGIASRMVFAMGLHRDGSSWGLSKDERNVRRRVFWEAFSTDVFLSRCWDRPTTFVREQFDTKLPEDISIYDTHRYNLSLLIKEALDMSVNIEPVAYDRVVDLWSRLTKAEADLPYHLKCRATVAAMVSRYRTKEEVEAASPELKQRDLKLAFQQHLTACEFCGAIFFLLRPYFVHVLYTHPSNPDQSPFAGAYYAVVERSTMFVEMLRSINTLYASMSTRHWQFWSHAFSSAVCMATICIASPSAPLAPLAMTQFESVIALFQEMLASSPRQGLTKSVEWLLWLHEKAKLKRPVTNTASEMMNVTRTTRPVSPQVSPSVTVTEDADAHLSLVGWRTRLIDKAPERNVNHRGNNIAAASGQLKESSDPLAWAFSDILNSPQSLNQVVFGEVSGPSVATDTNFVQQSDPFSSDSLAESAGQYQGGEESLSDSANMDLLQQLLGGPASQPFPVDWPWSDPTSTDPFLFDLGHGQPG